MKVLKFEEPLRSPAAKAPRTDPEQTVAVVKPIMVDACTDIGLSLDDLDYTRSYWESQPRPSILQNAIKTLTEAAEAGAVKFGSAHTIVI